VVNGKKSDIKGITGFLYFSLIPAGVTKITLRYAGGSFPAPLKDRETATQDDRADY
jgi:hypothetical protein